VRFPTIVKRITSLLTHRQVSWPSFIQYLCIPGSIQPSVLENETVDLLSFSVASIAHIGKIDIHLKPMKFRQYLSTRADNNTKMFEPFITPRSWQIFWRIPLPNNARNTWFRLLHDTIPCKKKLHRLLPDIHPSANCSFCGQYIEDNIHFFFKCTKKAPLWSLTILHFFPDYCRTYFRQIHNLVLSVSTFPGNEIDLECSPIASKVSLLSLFGCILQTIWQAHWNNIFRNTPFNIDTLFSNVQQMVFRLQNELTHEN